MSNTDDAGTDPAVELVRLQRLIGVEEKSYTDLLADVNAARAAAREAEYAAGRARAEALLLSADVQRARAAQDYAESLLDDLTDRTWRERVQ